VLLSCGQCRANGCRNPPFGAKAASYASLAVFFCSQTRSIANKWGFSSMTPHFEAGPTRPYFILRFSWHLPRRL
jgi:hypothetical protein